MAGAVATPEEEEKVRVVMVMSKEEEEVRQNHRVPTATAPTAAVVSDAVQGDKATGKQITRTMAEKMTPKDQETCKKHNICKWHAMYGDCKFGTLCRSSHLSAAERKAKGLSFAVSCAEDDLPRKNSEHEIMMDLLNGCCDLADAERIVAEPTAHGEAFHGQCGGLGFFALEMGTIITEETEQIIYSVEYEMRVDEVRAENMHIAMAADNVHIAIDADNIHIVMAADDMHIAMDADNARYAHRN